MVTSATVAEQIAALDALMRADPGNRQLCGYRHQGRLLLEGDLLAAAEHLATNAKSVGLVTGFPIVDADPPAAETDGPPGALFLARALADLGLEVALISDRYGVPLLEAGCDEYRLPRSIVIEVPIPNASSPSASLDLRRRLATDRGLAPTHWVAIERQGPAHTLQSLGAQPREGSPPLELFEQEVPLADRDRCHNARGAVIDAYTAPLDALFESGASSPATTIGIVDGGNEIGSGRLPWEIARQAIAGRSESRIICRVATDYTLLAGTCNWAAYALGLSICLLRERLDVVRDLGISTERSLIEHIVRDAGAVDGVLRRPVASVDGLPMDQYLKTLAAMRAVCGLE
jgi:hypothetical protein